MAEKGFGVKEVNLIGASGTPTITSPNNLNLNAVNVAISTNASIGGNLTVSGTVGIAGTLTYEDVTNIDSVGIVTAREGVFLPDNKELKIGNTAGSPDLKIYHNSSNNHSIIQESGTGSLRLQGNEIQLLNPTGTVFLAQFIPGSFVKLFHDGSNKFETNSSGVTITGTLAATAVTGDGSGLTGIAVTEAPVTDYTVSANGSSAYRFHGGGVDETANNPNLYLIRGQKYRFNNTTGSSHPFEFREADGGSAYSNGVSGDDEGVQFFTVPYDAPARIYYQCTIHGGMVGNIYIRGAGGNNNEVGLTTFRGNVRINQFAGTDARLDINEQTTTNPLRLMQTATEASIQNIASQPFKIRSQGGSGSNGYLAFWTRENERLRIQPSGQVGIGTDGEFGATNNVKLLVDGDMAIRNSSKGDNSVVQIGSYGKAMTMSTSAVNVLQFNAFGNGAVEITVFRRDTTNPQGAQVTKLYIAFGGSGNNITSASIVQEDKVTRGSINNYTYTITENNTYATLIATGNDNGGEVQSLDFYCISSGGNSRTITVL